MENTQMLRHLIATLAYRGGKAVHSAPKEFAAFKASKSTRTPAEILAHIGDLLDWALVYASEGLHRWHDSAPLAWEDEVKRFHSRLQALDDYLVSGQPLRVDAQRLVQGPIADALTHVGQLTMLRRMAGAPIRGENYFRAEITAGRTGADQAAPVREFD